MHQPIKGKSTNVYDRLFHAHPPKNRNENSFQNQNKIANSKCVTPNLRLKSNICLTKNPSIFYLDNFHHFPNFEKLGMELKREKNTGEKASARLYSNGIQRIAEKEKLIRDQQKNTEQLEMEVASFKTWNQ